jgi:hypothetical protein
MSTNLGLEGTAGRVDRFFGCSNVVAACPRLLRNIDSRLADRDCAAAAHRIRVAVDAKGQGPVTLSTGGRSDRDPWRRGCGGPGTLARHGDGYAPRPAGRAERARGSIEARLAARGHAGRSGDARTGRAAACEGDDTRRDDNRDPEKRCGIAPHERPRCISAASRARLRSPRPHARRGDAGGSDSTNQHTLAELFPLLLRRSSLCGALMSTAGGLPAKAGSYD